MNLNIRNKFGLVDLATLGTNARRVVKPNVMIADSHSRPFDLGDMLDANSTYNLINEVLLYTRPYSVIITETEYAKLENYEDNTIYFVIPDSSQSWTFGGTFPITLN